MNALEGLPGYNDDFERWMHRPVYVVQVFTCQIYKQWGLPTWWLRLVPKYRTAKSLAARRRLADHVRGLRRTGLTWREVRQQSHAIIDNPGPGIAERCDFEGMLEEVGIE